jgi:hypothetical protein
MLLGSAIPIEQQDSQQLETPKPTRSEKHILLTDQITNSIIPRARVNKGKLATVCR